MQRAPTAFKTAEAATNDMPLLETIGLTKAFDGFIAVQNLNLKVSRGSIHALIGPNGAGKTTSFNLITKFILPSAGRILFRGVDITPLPPVIVARQGLARSFQISSVFPHLTALENVRIALQRHRGESFDLWRSRRILDVLNDEALAILSRVGLAELSDHLATELPYGRKRALEIATTLALRPEILLLDEPTAGMASGDVQMISELIKGLGREYTILMVEHNLRMVSDICDWVTVLARGRVIAEGEYGIVASNPTVQEAYLGGVDAGLKV